MKRMLSILLCAVLLCGFIPHAAFAADEVLSLSSYERGEVEVRLSAPAALLLAAAYQGDRMVACEMKNDCAAGTYRFSLPVSYRYRVFALDGAYAPLCEALEITDEDAVVLLEETGVPLPTLDDSVASALGAAISEYAKVSLALLQIQELFADEDAFAAIEDDPDLYQQTSELLSETMDALQNATPSFAALDAVTEKQIIEISDDLALMSNVSLQSADEVITWAEELTKQFDALEGNNRVQQLAKNMGCDVKTAYNALTAAQDALYKRYNADADCYGNWEKAMIAVKATSKVAFFVCATAATAGAASIAGVPAALTTGTVTTAEAAGIMVGTADVALELSVDAAKIIIGGTAKGDQIIQRTEDRLKPVTDALLLYSLCTVNTANNAERLAFLGDLGQRGKEVYDNITVKVDDSGNLNADMLRLAVDDPTVAAEIAKKKGLSTEEIAFENSMETAVEGVETEYGKDRDALKELLEEEGLVESDADFNKLVKDYNDKIIEELNNTDPDPDPSPSPRPDTDPDPEPPRRERIVESYDSDTGMLTGITCYDSKGREVWKRVFDQGKVSNFYVYEWDENGDRITTQTRYYEDPVTGFYTTQIEWIRKERYIGGSYTNEKLIDELTYNPNGTIAEHVYYDAAGSYHRKQYDGNGQISLDLTRYADGTYHELSYYTTNDPNVPGVERIGHLQYDYEYYEEQVTEYFSNTVYTSKKTWTAVKLSNYTEKCYEYGWNYTHISDVSGYVDSWFELVYSAPMPEE